MNALVSFLRTSGWKVLLLVAVAMAVPACATHTRSSGPGAKDSPSGPMP
jgi:hypothetical protein